LGIHIILLVVDGKDRSEVRCYQWGITGENLIGARRLKLAIDKGFSHINPFVIRIN